MPLTTDDDVETALIVLASVFEKFDDRVFTGAEVSVALRNIADMVHATFRKPVQRPHSGAH